ncbi:transcription termination/antitermination protein NusG [Candidatus Nitrospira bockiana]
MGAPTSSPQWFAIRTYSRAEKVVRDGLVQRGVRPLLPTVCTVQHWKDRHKAIEWPLFPGYCFARVSSEQYRMVLLTPGVMDIVGGRGAPEPVPPDQLVSLERLATSDGHRHHVPYRETDKGVSVIRGPFRGLRGTLMETPDGYQLVVCIPLIRQAAAVEIDPADVRPAYEMSATGSGASKSGSLSYLHAPG